MLLPISDFTNVPPNAAMAFPFLYWDQILKLLGLVIVADKKTLPVEVDTFMNAVGELRDLIDPNTSLTQFMARDWFTLNREALGDIINRSACDELIFETLAPIKSIPHKMDIISSMVQIAVSDDDYADVEKSLIKNTILHWDIPIRH